MTSDPHPHLRSRVRRLLTDGGHHAPYAEGRSAAEWLRVLNDRGLLRTLPSIAEGASTLTPRGICVLAEELGFIDPSLGWLFTTHTVAMFYLPLLPAEGLAEVLGHPSLLLAAAGDGQVRARRAPGGWSIDGDWRLVSGAPLATHHLVRFEADGSIPMIAVLDAAAVERVPGSWQGAGLVATGSECTRTRDSFVPDHRVATLCFSGDHAEGASRYLTLGFVVLGATRRALVEADALSARDGAVPAELRPDRAAQRAIAVARWQSARYWRFHLSDALTAGGDDQRQLDAESALCDAHLYSECRDAVVRLCQRAGSAALDLSSTLGRIHMDVIAAGAHPSFRPDRTSEAGSRLEVPS